MLKEIAKMDLKDHAITLATTIKDDVESLFNFEFASLDRCKENEGLLNLCCKRYRDLRELQQHLLELAVIVKKKRNELRQETLIPAKLYHGYRALPDEIILRLASHLPSDDLLTFSHVNQRIRQLLCSPTASHLWTTIAASDPAGFTRMKLERSRDSPLDIVLGFRGYRNYKRNPRFRKPSLACMNGERHRWLSITFDDAVRGPEISSTFVFPRRELQSVKMLNLPGYVDLEYIYGPEEVPYYYDECQAFHRTWTWEANASLHSLTTLVLREDIPASATSPDVCFPHLTDLRFIFEAPTLIRECDFVSFLADHEALESLSISVDCAALINGTFYYPSYTYRIKFPHLKKLHASLRLRDIKYSQDAVQCSSSRDSFSNLLRSFTMPVAEELELEWREKFNFDRDRSEDENKPFLPPVKRFLYHEDMKCLKSVQLSVGPFRAASWGRVLKPFLTELHERIPSIEKVTCHVPERYFEEAKRVVPSSLESEGSRWTPFPEFDDTLAQFVESESKILAEIQTEETFAEVRAQLAGVNVEVRHLL